MFLSSLHLPPHSPSGGSERSLLSSRNVEGGGGDESREAGFYSRSITLGNQVVCLLSEFSKQE